MKCLIPILLTAVTGFAQTATYLTGQSARLVIGQPEFDSESDTATSSIVGAVSGVAWANNALFVADANMVSAAPINNRVLIYTNINGQLPSPTAPLNYTSQCPICVGVANVVLGQPDFVTTTPIPCITPPPNISTTTTPTSPVCPANAPQTPLATGMRNPTAVASDGTHLAVADTNNNRVLIWNSIPTSNDQPPDVVVGQTDFTSAGIPPNQTPTATSLRNPQGVWLQGGKLFVADTQNDRVLIYNSIPTSNGAAADVVLGQPNMTTYVQINIAEQSTSAANNNLLTPVSVTSDGTRLYVADLGYNRVLIWNTIPTGNQQPADVEVGQPDMAGSLPNNAFTCSISGTCPATATGQGVETAVLCTVSNGVDFNNNPTYPTLCGSTLSFPRYALSDGTRLYIADGGNDRVLVYNTIPTVSGVAADVILGQTSDTSDEATDGSDSLNTPMGLAWDGANLYIADCYNQRIVVYTPNGQNLPYSAVRNAASINIYAVGTVTIGGTIKSGDKVTVTIGLSTTTTTETYTYAIQSGDDAAAIVNGLVALINAGKGDPNVLATADVAADEVVLTAKTAGADGDNVTLATSISTNATVTAVTSAANLSGGGDAASIAPGSLVEIMGTNLSNNVTMSAPADAMDLPTNLGGVQVSFNGVPAPLLYVSPTQINAQVPFQFEFTSGTVNAWVRTQNADGSVAVTNTVGVSIVPANPGIFAGTGNDPRPAIAMHSSNYASALISVDGVVQGGDVGTICIGSTAALTPVSAAPATGCTGQTYNYTVQETDTLATVVSAFLVLMANDPQVSVQAAGEFTRIVVYARTPGPAGNGIPMSVAVSTGARLLLTAIGPPLPSPGVGVLTCCASTAGATITPTSQAIPGETIIVYATGLGLPVLTPPVAPYLLTGQKYQGPANNTPGQSVSALVNATSANVIEAALIPGTVGLYQVSLALNSSLTSDPYAQLTIAQNDFVSNVVTIPVNAIPLLSSLTCASTSLNSDASTTCTVTLSVVAPSGGVTVALSSSSSLLSVPSSVSVAAAATSATFTAATGSIPSSQSATITATLNSSTANVTITLGP